MAVHSLNVSRREFQVRHLLLDFRGGGLSGTGARRFCHCAVHPPSMIIVCPVTLRDQGPIRYSTAAATSSQVVNAFFGIGCSMTRWMTSSSDMLRVRA